MKFIRTILLTFGLVSLLSAGAIDKADRQALLDHLDKSSSEFLDSVKDLSSAQWSYKASPDSWSIAECAEHIALTEDFLRDIISKKILTAPAAKEPVADKKELDGKVLKMITDRSTKAQAPEPLKPAKQFDTPAAALEKFKSSRATTIALAKERDDLRDHAAPHPALKELDGYQWLLYLSGHTMRHTAQIREVKSAAGYPKQ